jgi:hypothetical protein
MIKSRKEKMISPIHISANEQISRHFGKASIQDERVCTLKLELVEITLLARRKDSPKKVRKTFIFVIEITLQLGGSTEKYYLSL